MRKLYEFRCPECGHEFEELIDQEEQLGVECPRCRAKAQRVPIAQPKHRKHSSWRVS